MNELTRAVVVLAYYGSKAYVIKSRYMNWTPSQCPPQGKPDAILAFYGKFNRDGSPVWHHVKTGTIITVPAHIIEAIQKHESSSNHIDA